MTAAPPPELIRQAAVALRYTLAVLDETSRQAAGGSPDHAVPVTMDVAEALALAPALAHLVLGARCVLAENLGIDGPEAQAAWARAQLQGELEAHEMSAAFADVEAEMRSSGG
jgi:hypothetical protein